MTEVVTNGAAFMRPFLQSTRLQASGISNQDSQQISAQVSAEASRAEANASAQEVPRASEDRSSLQNDSSPQSNSRPEPSRLKAAAANSPAAPANAPTGPSKARVDIAPLQLAQPASVSAQAQAPAATPQTQAASTLTAATPAPAPTPAPATDPAPAPASDTAPVVSPGALGPAASLNTLAVENLSQNIIGVAFAPTQVTQTSDDDGAIATQPQRNFIFAQRKVFTEAQQTDKFAAEDSRRQFVAEEASKTPKFAVQATAQFVTTVASGKFATTEDAQKLSDKTQQAETPIVENGEARLYDKVAEGDAGNRFAQEDAQQQSQNQGRGNSRESLHQRAEAIAQALGTKAAHPEVKKLIADIARYRASHPGTGAASVIVTA